jgi:hypothetical protein
MRLRYQVWLLRYGELIELIETKENVTEAIEIAKTYGKERTMIVVEGW